MKKILFFLLIIAALPTIFFWFIIKDGYDKQNEYILLLKKFIPNYISRPIRDTVFIIPKKINESKVNSLLKQKKEQGYEGKLLNQKIITSKNKKKIKFKEFFLPFDKLDTSIGYQAEANSLRAHYLEIVDNHVVAISGKGKTIFFKKKNLFNTKLNQELLPNNIDEILKNNKLNLIGIRSLFYNNSKIYISLLFKNTKGYSMNIYEADFNFKKLNFKLFYPTNKYTSNYNIHTAGRLTNFKDNKFILSIGAPKGTRNNAQNINSIEGKIISIDKKSKAAKIISMGHRNPQGLFYDQDLDLIINTEHGPKGGDEINFNYIDSNEIPNFGWPISSYGVEYSGENPFKATHKKYGFLEPFKNYTPSIGISELVFIKGNKKELLKNTLIVSSLRAASLYILKLNDDYTNIISEDRIYFPNQRLRDIAFDEANNILLIMFEQIPSIGVIDFNE